MDRDTAERTFGQTIAYLVTSTERPDQAIRDAGFVIDRELWNAKAADCHQCHACCSDSPVA
ncbi:Syd protein [Streptomyces sp. NBRC 110611]|uniref:hypothetical protein n=1 Tax=Streptomyces sp. NBRC 110611 TaxID=1621259 RepID=UPI0008343DAD|nr:hypothetical protein [Streptomyces sp. NBRC 110611]GAU68550.1 Syd protein [Streptomyces sp. NBRC 110611]